MLPQIERYELDREIGHGGMATVYRARDARLDRWVAVKVMHPHLRGADEARARFSREARAVARLHHPSILEIYDYSGFESENAYIATELLTGPTLRAFADTQPEIPVEVVACIGFELASALAAAHAEGIVHRDVKPENVLLHEDRCVKLTDFGIAGMLDPSASAMTATGQILGSPAHMSPEQITEGHADTRSDVFALGTILYWLATGQLPFDGKNPHQILKRVVDHTPADPLILRPTMGRALARLLMRCLEKHPDERFQSAEELAEQLCLWLAKLGIDDPRATLSEYLHAPERVTADLRASSIDHLLATARAEVGRGDRIAAVDSLDRVLALQDGHPEALALLERLDSAAVRRSLLRWTGAVSLAALLTAGSIALWPNGASPESPPGGSVEPETARIAADPPEPSQVSGPPAPGQREQAGPPAPADGPDEAAAPEARERGPSPEAREPSVETQARAARNGRARKTRPARAARARRAAASEPRRVVFKPYPVNVSIGVDGGPLTPLGPDFQSVELEPGEHRFRFVGARECCVDKTLRVDLPPGPGTTVLEPRLEFRPARLYVVSNVPANVDISGGRAGGRTRSVISVPVDRSLIEPHRISVTAPGYEPYTRNVSLRAGKVKQVRVDLKPVATQP